MKTATNLIPPGLRLQSGELPLLAAPAQKATPQLGSHCVQFYDDESAFAESLTEFLSEGLKQGEACVVIGTPEHRQQLAERLLQHGLDVVNDGLGELYYPFDAEALLSQFMFDESVDESHFIDTVGEVIKNICARGQPVRAFGEMVALLAARGNYDGAIELEKCWNRLQSRHTFTLLCAYPLANFHCDVATALPLVCNTHSQIIPAENYNGLATPEERLRAIVLLQQKATALQLEIAERADVEVALRSARDDLKKLLVSEQLARAEAVTANRMKDEFLATVSHELRTPLNAILGWTHMLAKGTLDPPMTQRAIETIERNARAQAQLVEDILDVSRIITGKLQLDVKMVDVAAIINAAIDSVQPAASSKEIEIEVTIDPLIRHVAADANRLQQIVWNLLSNAIKFTPAGGRVWVSLKRDGGEIKITVADNGKGIDPAFVPYIFERFRQEDASTTRTYGGLGLGLSIVRHLVELHGGTVSAHSDGEGTGAAFTISLPHTATWGNKRKLKRRRSTLAPLPEPVMLPTPSIAGLTILLVDDDVDTLRMLAQLLIEQQATIETANSVKGAMEVLERVTPDLIVSDLAMPGEDGYSLIETIRERETADKQPVQAIALTALARIEDRARALAAGFNMFLVKPVQPTELITAIAELTELSQRATAIA